MPSTSPRVTFVTVNYAPETTGIAAYTTSLAQGLAKRGFQVNVVTAAPHYPAWRVSPTSEWQAEEVSDRVHISRLRSYVPARPNFLNRTLFEILFGMRFAARSYRHADTVVLVSPALFASAVMSARFAVSRRRPRTVLWIQDRYSAGVQELSSGLGRLGGGLVRAVESWVARSADRVVVIHDRWVDPVTETLGVDRDRLTVVRNWSHVTMPEHVDVGAVRNGLGWGKQGDEVVVLHTGNMGAKQGLENVVAAARVAESQGLPLRFVLVGDGNQRERLQHLAEGCAALQFVPPLPQDAFMGALAAADVLLLNELPGLAETAVPSKLTSYFASGRPVLAATESSSVSADEVRASGAGRVIAPGDPAALVDAAMQLAAATPDLAAGPRYVRRALSEDAGIASFEALLRCEAAPSRPPAHQTEGSRS